jgi:hypothetical protein
MRGYSRMFATIAIGMYHVALALYICVREFEQIGLLGSILGGGIGYPYQNLPWLYSVSPSEFYENLPVSY